MLQSAPPFRSSRIFVERKYTRRIELRWLTTANQQQLRNILGNSSNLFPIYSRIIVGRWPEENMWTIETEWKTMAEVQANRRRVDIFVRMHQTRKYSRLFLCIHFQTNTIDWVIVCTMNRLIYDSKFPFHPSLIFNPFYFLCRSDLFYLSFFFISCWIINVDHRFNKHTTVYLLLFGTICVENVPKKIGCLLDIDLSSWWTG